MFVSRIRPDEIIEQGLGRRGLNVQWANSIKSAADLLGSAFEKLAW